MHDTELVAAKQTLCLSSVDCHFHATYRHFGGCVCSTQRSPSSARLLTSSNQHNSPGGKNSSASKQRCSCSFNSPQREGCLLTMEPASRCSAGMHHTVNSRNLRASACLRPASSGSYSYLVYCCHLRLMLMPTGHLVSALVYEGSPQSSTSHAGSQSMLMPLRRK